MQIARRDRPRPEPAEDVGRWPRSIKYKQKVFLLFTERPTAWLAKLAAADRSLSQGKPLDPDLHREHVAKPAT